MAFIQRLMILVLVVFFFSGPSPASACDRCVRRSTAVYRASSHTLDKGTQSLLFASISCDLFARCYVAEFG
jgi:hypothetical protein